jgi:hypothetical protein
MAVAAPARPGMCPKCRLPLKHDQELAFCLHCGYEPPESRQRPANPPVEEPEGKFWPWECQDCGYRGNGLTSAQHRDECPERPGGES